MTPFAQILCAIAAGTVLSAGGTIITQMVQAARVKERLDNSDRVNTTRHMEHRELLAELLGRVGQINGRVSRGEAVQEIQAKEIDRLRDARKP